MDNSDNNLVKINIQKLADNKNITETLPDNIAENKLFDMSNSIMDLCDSLSVDTKRFKESDFLNNLRAYIGKYGRLLYSDISDYIFSIEEVRLSSFEVNLKKVVDFVYQGPIKQEQSNSKNNKKCAKDDEIKKTVIKLWDHVNLAKRQLVQLKQSDGEFTNKFNGNISSFKEEMTKEMNAQLISLVGLFTAMSFLVFGGINSLDNIFSGAKDIDIIKIMIIGTIWGLCIQNLVFVFMFFISKLTKTSIKSNECLNANFIQKYPLMCWSNLVFIFLLVICLWLYFIDYANIGGWLINWSKDNQTKFGIGGIVIIALAAVLVSYRFIKLYREK